MEILSLSMIALASAFALALVITPLAAKIGGRAGLLDHPGERKPQKEPVPTGGGIAIFLAIALSVAAIAVYLRCAGPDADESIRQTATALFDPAGRARWIAMAAGGVVIFLMGLADDRWGLGPWLKLSINVVVACVLVASGLRVSVLVEWWWFGAALTVLWIVGITNAFNLLDNMDGLSAGVASMSAFVFFVVMSQTGQPLPGILFVVTAGAAAGFFFHNRHPAKVYMGDAGSLLLGYCLATMSIAGTYYRYSFESAVPLVTPVIILAIPIFDTASVLYIRWREGRPFFVGDRSHFSHRLVDLGMTVRRSVETIYVLTLVMGLGAAMLLAPPGGMRGVLTLVQAVVILGVVVLLETAGRRKA